MDRESQAREEIILSGQPLIFSFGDKMTTKQEYVADKIEECLRYGQHYAEFGPEFSARLYATRARAIYTENGVCLSEQNLPEYLRTNEKISALESKVL